ncbi:MAG: hypothetical protein IPJ52_15035 [Rhodocyclaceae bacterium]|nr:hypothetical protein [Rhodocyclaceae bacterium]
MTKGILRRRAIFGLLPALALGACVYVPRTVEFIDPECKVVARHMVLQEVQIAAIMGCANEGCVTLVVAAAATAAVSAVISGSIVVAGNTVYWFERRGQCRRQSRDTVPPE